MTIRNGDQAPDFSLAHEPGKTIALNDLIGNGPVVILFFPLSFSSVCTDELCHMKDTWQQWSSLDATVIGICPDSPFVTRRFREDLNLPFPVLSDFNRDVARQWDVLYEEFHGMNGVPKRACFVLNKSGVVVYDWVAEDSGVLPDFEAIANACSRK